MGNFFSRLFGREKEQPPRAARQEMTDDMTTLAGLETAMRSRGLSGYFDAMKPFVRNAVHITPVATEDGNIAVGASKFGGCPDLPAGMDWFRVAEDGTPMSFVAQINFEDIKPFDLENELPERGILYFFYDCDEMPWGFEPEDCTGWKVFFCEDPTALRRAAAPEDLDEDYRFGAAMLRLRNQMEIPSCDSDLLEDVKLPDAEEDAYDEWLAEQEEELINKLLGHSNNVQSGMEQECENVTAGIGCGTPDGFERARTLGLDGNADRWRLLLQVDSNEDLGMMWGDMGRLYLWIKREDLAARSFEKAWLILQCG